MYKKITITDIFNDVFTNYENKESTISFVINAECTCGESRCLIHELPSNYKISDIEEEKTLESNGFSFEVGV